MTNTLREHLGHVAYRAFHGDLGDWGTAPERERERWRDAAMAVAEVAIILASEVAVKTILRDEMIAPMQVEHQVV